MQAETDDATGWTAYLAGKTKMTAGTPRRFADKPAQGDPGPLDSLGGPTSPVQARPRLA